MGLRTGLDRYRNRKFLSPLGSKPQTIQPHSKWIYQVHYLGPSRSGGGGQSSSSSSRSSLQNKKKWGILCYYPCTWGMWRCSWLRHCTASRKVTGLIPNGLTGIFHWQSFQLHCGPGVDLASSRNEYQKYFLGGKGCVGLTTLPLSCADHLEIWEPEPPGTLRACPGMYRDCFTFYPCTYSSSKWLGVMISARGKIVFLYISSSSSGTYILPLSPITGSHTVKQLYMHEKKVWTFITGSRRFYIPWYYKTGSWTTHTEHSGTTKDYTLIFVLVVNML